MFLPSDSAPEASVEDAVFVRLDVTVRSFLSRQIEFRMGVISSNRGIGGVFNNPLRIIRAVKGGEAEFDGAPSPFSK